MTFLDFRLAGPYDSSEPSITEYMDIKKYVTSPKLPEYPYSGFQEPVPLTLEGIPVSKFILTNQMVNDARF